MRQAIWFTALGLLGGFAVSAWWSDAALEAPSETAQPTAGFASRAPGDDALAAQVAALERELEALRSDVTRLVEASGVLAESLEPEPAGPSVADNPARPETQPASPDEAATPPPRARRFRLRTEEGRLEALSEAGFTLDQAQRIERRVEELRVETMQARYDAQRRGEPLDPQALLDENSRLRAELGDADYERYLDAFGQPTSVSVSSVLASSPAEQAGFESGDEIVAYAGQRVFDMRELNQSLLAGEPGESVVVDIVRDGQPMQLVIPRGPLGISGGGGSRRLRVGP